MIDSAEITRWEGLCKAVISDYFAPKGMTRDDLLQEARIGLYKGLRDFDPDGGAILATFLTVCIRRQVITALKSATRHKHEPLNRSITVDTDENGQPLDALDLISSPGLGPAGRLACLERLKEISRKINEELSDAERRCLVAVQVEGRPYREVSAELKMSEKGVDNALQPARRKLEPLRVAA